MGFTYEAALNWNRTQAFSHSCKQIKGTISRLVSTKYSDLHDTRYDTIYPSLDLSFIVSSYWSKSKKKNLPRVFKHPFNVLTLSTLRSKLKFSSDLWPLFIYSRSSGEKLIKYHANTSCVIMSLILMTTLFTTHWFYLEKFDADHLGFKGLKLSVLLYPSRLALLFAGWQQLICKFSVKNSENNLKLECFLGTSYFLHWQKVAEQIAREMASVNALPRFESPFQVQSSLCILTFTPRQLFSEW